MLKLRTSPGDISPGGTAGAPTPEFVLTGVLCIIKVLKGTEIVFVLTRVHLIYYMSITSNIKLLFQHVSFLLNQLSYCPT